MRHDVTSLMPEENSVHLLAIRRVTVLLMLSIQQVLVLISESSRLENPEGMLVSELQMHPFAC